MRILETIVISGLIGLGAVGAYSQKKIAHKHSYIMEMDSTGMYHRMDKNMHHYNMHDNSMMHQNMNKPMMSMHGHMDMNQYDMKPDSSMMHPGMDKSMKCMSHYDMKDKPDMYHRMDGSMLNMQHKMKKDTSGSK